MRYLCDCIPQGATVLDVGPGRAPFPRATQSVDFEDWPGAVNLVKCDFSSEPLPFADKSFDFIFCRHVLEDLYNPFLLLKEMARVGKAGYIETPSPLAEIGRGVDGSSPTFRGYHHHRFIVWNVDGQLRFVTKFPVIEWMEYDDAAIVHFLREGPKYWNTYLMWQDCIDHKHLQCPLDYDICQDYQKVLTDAANFSMESTDKFWRDLPVEAASAA